MSAVKNLSKYKQKAWTTLREFEKSQPSTEYAQSMGEDMNF
jgi:hypothetical protein